MAADEFEIFETDGEGQRVMPLLITDQVLVQPIQQPGGVALLLRSTPNSETGQPVETQWFLTPDQAAWQADHPSQSVASGSGTARNQNVSLRNTHATNGISTSD